MRNFKQTSTTRLLGVLAGIGLTLTGAHAQTVITGPNISGTWSPSGNPYIVAANCTVPSGQTLTVQPGTIVWMGEGTSLTGNGVISAVGTSGQRIAFQSISGGGKWNTIIVNNTVGTNEFKYCDFSGATNALDFRGASRNEVMFCTFSNGANAGVIFRDNSFNTMLFCIFQDLTHGVWMGVSGQVVLTQTSTFMNCAFSNCYANAIYGEAVGSHGNYYGDVYTKRLNATVKNSHFCDVSNACRFDIRGASWSPAYAYGYGDVQLMNNTFRGVTNTAVWLSAGAYGSGTAALMNNTIVNAGQGVYVQDPWDATNQNNIFKNCSTGMTRSGSLSATISYNAFQGNSTNFIGYPVTYGQILLVNRNGTPSDVLYNIFSDPMFVSSTDLHLQVGSPCIDAGEGSAANYDSYFPPSMGGAYNDIGAYGGSGAGHWLDAAPYSPNVIPIMGIAPYVGVTINPPSPGHYRVEYASELQGTNNWLQLTNLDLYTTPFIYFDPVSSPQRFYRTVKQ